MKTTKRKRKIAQCSSRQVERLVIRQPKTKLVFTDRYEAMGKPLPNPANVCLGYCEGTGIIPVYMRCGDKRTNPKILRVRGRSERNELLRKLWWKKELEHRSEDGWHMVPCPKCVGTGRRVAA
jgi:hypothetical protein